MTTFEFFEALETLVDQAVVKGLTKNDVIGELQEMIDRVRDDDSIPE